MLLLLDPYVDAILVLALAFLIQAIMKSVGAPLRSLPFPLNQLANTADSIARAITNACGTILHPLDTKVGQSFVGLAGLINRLSAFLRSNGRTLAGIASFVQPFAVEIAALRALVHQSVHANTGTAAQVKTLERELHGIEHQVKQLERDLSKGIGDDVLPKLKKINREIAHIDNAELPAIRSNVGTADTAIGNLFDWIRGKADIIGAGTFVGAITAALALVGNGWLGCKENPFSSSKTPCSLWGDLARFMPLLGLLAIAFDFEEFVDASEEVASFIGKSVAAFEGTFPVSLPPLPPPQ